MRSLQGMELKKNVLGPVKCLQIPFHLDKCIWCMTAVLGHKREVNQGGNRLRKGLEVVIQKTVQISQYGRQYSRNTGAQVLHFLSLPL